MNCQYCSEPVLAGELTASVLNGELHRECMIRMILGSKDHQMKRCPCFGGKPLTETGTLRDGARAAALYFDFETSGEETIN